MEKFNLMKWMETLDEINREICKSYSIDNSPIKDGIKCPKCNKDLYSTPMTTSLTDPHQRAIHCKCGYKGYRINLNWQETTNY